MTTVTIPLSSDQLDDFVDKFYDIPEPDVILRQSIDIEYGNGVMSYFKVKTDKCVVEVIINPQSDSDPGYLRCDSDLVSYIEPFDTSKASYHRLRFNVWRDIIVNSTMD